MKTGGTSNYNHIEVMLLPSYRRSEEFHVHCGEGYLFKEIEKH